MILTDKALDDFYTWIEKEDFPLSKYAIKNNLVVNVVLNALIIEWFDSVGIYIGTESEYIYEHVGFYAYVNNKNLNKIFELRQEATEQAILKANEIYNERTNISN